MVLFQLALIVILLKQEHWTREHQKVAENGGGIYVKSGNRLFADTKSKIKQAVRELRDAKKLAVDTETSSLDPHTAKLWSVQFGNEDFQAMIPVNNGMFDIGEFEDILLDDQIVKIMHRATFDLKILRRRGWDVNGTYCTRTMEQIISAGYYSDTSLAGCLRRYLGVEMSKVVRKDFYCDVDDKEADANGTITKFEFSGMKWTPELIDYALDDVQHLVPLMDAQVKKLKEADLLPLAQKIELPLVYVTSLLEYRGVKMDRERTLEFQRRMKSRAEAVKIEVVKNFNHHWREYATPIYEHNLKVYQDWKKRSKEILLETNRLYRDPNNKRKITSEGKAIRQSWRDVKPFNTPPKAPVVINLNSPQQMRAALDHAGVSLPNMQQDTLVNAAVEHPMLFEYVEFRKFEKLAQMSDIYLKINPATGRIHGELNQNVDTGRFSSKNPNLQNIPARTKEGEEFRTLFIASVGNILIVADFSAIELVIIGIKSGDKNLLHALNNNLDLHCWTMSKFLNCDYDALVKIKDSKEPKKITSGLLDLVRTARTKFEKAFNLPELKKCGWDAEGIQKWVNVFRGYVKTLTYGIAYGLSAFGLSRKFHCDVKEAERFIDVFFGVYPQIRKWLERLADIAMDCGYSKTASGRRRYYRRPRKPTRDDVKKAVAAFLKDQKRDPDSLSPEEEDALWDQTSKRLWREYKQTIGRIRRQAANQPIQGLSADITKLAMVLWEDWWAEFAPTKKINIFKFGIVLTVHDEIVLDVPLKVADICAEKLKWAMETAAKKLLGSDANIVVKPVKTPFWKK